MAEDDYADDYEDNEEEDGYSQFCDRWEALDYIHERMEFSAQYKYYGFAQLKDDAEIGDYLESADVLAFGDDDLSESHELAEDWRQSDHCYLAVVGSDEEPTPADFGGAWARVPLRERQGNGYTPLNQLFGRSRIVAVLEYRD